MRRVSVNPLDDDEIISLNYRRRSSLLVAGAALRKVGAQKDESSSQTSHIVEFYEQRSVLVTGASGFIGKLLVEKLLRTCPNLKRIFVLIRPRRNKSPAERLDDIFKSPIFDQLRESKRQLASDGFQKFLQEKVQLLDGDLTEPMLGLHEANLKQLLASEVSVILHSAAMVSFDGKLRKSLKTNLTGTMNVLEIACKLPQLAALVHVSTCYSNCTRWHVDEHIYPVDSDPMQLIGMVECIDDDTVEVLKSRLLSGHPNPYTYSKQLAEYLVGQYGIRNRLPVIICRPSIVIGTLEEPLAGFTDNRSGMNGIFWGMNRGLLRTAHGEGSSLADQVPADMVVSSIIALSWFGELYHRVGRCIESGKWTDDCDKSQPLINTMISFYKDRKTRLLNKLSSDDSLRSLQHKELVKIPVCHVSSGVENPISFHDMLDHVAKGGSKYPSINLFRKPSCRFTPNARLNKLYQFWYHTLVGVLLNLLSVGMVAPVRRSSMSNSLQAVPTMTPQSTTTTTTTRRVRTNWLRDFRRIDKFVDVLSYFTSNTWHFNPDTRRRLMRDFMSVKDNQLFNCDTAAIDWPLMGDKIAFGLRKYVLNEREETIRAARVKFRKSHWRNTGIQFVSISILFYIVYMLVLF